MFGHLNAAHVRGDGWGAGPRLRFLVFFSCPFLGAGGSGEGGRGVDKEEERSVGVSTRVLEGERASAEGTWGSSASARLMAALLAESSCVCDTGSEFECEVGW